jgi:hypothetical protein
MLIFSSQNNFFQINSSLVTKATPESLDNGVVDTLEYDIERVDIWINVRSKFRAVWLEVSFYQMLLVISLTVEPS